MLTLAVCAWLALFLLVELSGAVYAAQALGLALSLIITMVATLAFAELDILAALLLAIYGSVFVFLAALSAHFGPLSQPAAARPAGGYVLAGLCLLVACNAPALALAAGQPAATWQALAAFAAAPVSLQTLHFFFYSCFVAEALLLNVYLLAGLAAALSLLALMAPRAAARGQAPVPLRVPARQRRQTRRAAGTAIRNATS